MQRLFPKEIKVSDYMLLMNLVFHFCLISPMHFFSTPAIFEAEGISAPLNRYLHDHMTELHRLKAQYKLATNDKVIDTITPCIFTSLVT